MRKQLGAAPTLDPDAATKKYVDDEIAGVVLAAGISGPGTTVDNAIVRWDGTDGSAVQSSGVTISDTDDLTVPGDISAANLSGTNTGDQDLSGLVPNTRTVNGHALSSNVTVTKSDVGLGNVDNTADSAKPISTATQAALDDKVPTTRTVNGHALSSNVTVTKSDVSLGNVDNTSDASKPVSTATQTALDAKADLVGGYVPTSQLPALAYTAVNTVANQAAMLALTGIQPGDLAVRTDGAGTFVLAADPPSTLANWVLLNAPTDVVTSVNSQTGTVVLAKGDVGLGNVDNTSDATKNAAAVTLTNKFLDSAKADEFLDVNGNQILRLPEIASAVNCYYITNQSTGNYPTIGVDGSDSNIGMAIVPKGTGPFRIIGQGANHPTIEGIRGDGNGDLNLNTAGTGVVKANGNQVVTTNAVPLGNATGNLSVNRLNGGSNANQYTFWRGDGVWAGLVLSPLATTNTMTTDEGKYTAILTVTQTAQYQTTLVTGFFGDVSGGPGGYARGSFAMRVRQEAAMTNDPLVDLRITSHAYFDTTKLVAVCTEKSSGQTVVTLYAKLDTEYEGWFVLPGIMDVAKVTFLYNQSWQASLSGLGTQFPATYELITTGTPTLAQHAATKSYVDTAIAAVVPSPIETTYDLGMVSSSATLSLSNGTMQSCSLSPSTLCTFAMPTPVAGASLAFAVRNPGGGGSAYFTGVKWPGDIPPVITIAPGKMDALTFLCFDGLTWIGAFTQNYTVADPTAGARAAVVPPGTSKHWGGGAIRTLGRVVRRGRD